MHDKSEPRVNRVQVCAGVCLGRELLWGVAARDKRRGEEGTRGGKGGQKGRETVQERRVREGPSKEGR